MKWLIPISFILGQAVVAVGETYHNEEFEVLECQGQPAAGSPGSEPCYFHMKSRSSGMTSKLVIFFSGGEMSCDENFASPSNYDRLMKRYADDNYVAVCAGLFLSSQSEWETIPPYHRYASRVSTLVQAITSSPRVRSLWDGRDLLFSGVSHGATAPVIAMARSTFDDAAHWKGSRTTGACFLDGLVDSIKMDAFWWQHRLSCGSFRERGVCLRYNGTEQNCSYPIARTNDVLLDSLASAKPTDFAIKHWKLVECGSQMVTVKCPSLLNGDVVPMEPIQALCDTIRGGSSSGHSCTFDRMSRESHLKCSTTDEGIDKCRSWFNTKIGL